MTFHDDFDAWESYADESAPFDTGGDELIAPPPRFQSPVPRHRLLVLDDDRSLADGFARFARSIFGPNWDVVAVSDLGAAMDELRHGVEVILSDFNLQECTTSEPLVIEALNDGMRPERIVVVSSRPDLARDIIPLAVAVVLKYQISEIRALLTEIRRVCSGQVAEA